MLPVTKSVGRSFWAAAKQMRIGKGILEIVGVGGWVSNRTISSKATMTISGGAGNKGGRRQKRKNRGSQSGGGSNKRRGQNSSVVWAEQNVTLSSDVCS